MKFVGVLLAAMVVAAACGGDDDGDEAGGGSNSGGNGNEETPVEEVSSEVDRDGRFAGLEEFCLPPEGEPEEGLEATDPGITADSISVAHVRSQLEDLVDIGFAVEIGDMRDQVQTFVDLINEECGGIHGRQIRLSTTDVPIAGLGGDANAEAQAACIEVAEDNDAVMAIALGAIGGPLPACLTAKEEVIFISSGTGSETEYEQAEGRWFSTYMNPTDLLQHTVRYLRDELEGKRIGVVYLDSDANPQIVQQGLIAEIEAQGLELVRADVLGCDGGSVCTEGIIPSVQGMVTDGVDVIFPLLNVITLPMYMAEMATQGVQPGEIQLYNTAYHSQDGDLVSGKVVEFGGEPAGQLYDGTVIVANALSGDFRAPGFEPPPFGEMCNRVYAEHSDVITEPYDPADGAGSTMFGAVSTHCHLVRLVARAIDAAGPNPTRADLAEALGSLGGIDLGSGVAASYRPGKTTAPDEISRLTFHYPCPQDAQNASGACIIPDEGDYIPLPED